MEWKEGNLAKARELYQRALSIDSTTESAARCLQVSDALCIFLVASNSIVICKHTCDRLGVF